MNHNAPHKTMISVAPNGGRLKKADHSQIPITLDEIVYCAAECQEAGASMIHVHIRDENGNHLLDAQGYTDVINSIHQALSDKLLVQITTESIGKYTPEQQITLVKQVRPQSASMALRELLPNKNSENEFSKFMLWLKAENILPQIILYSLEEARLLKDLIKRGVMPYNDIPVLFVLGRYTIDNKSSPIDLLAFANENHSIFGHWTICAFGKQESACAMTACLLDGHARVGFENNYYMPDGSIAKNNAQLVRLLSDQLSNLGLQTSNAHELAESWQQILDR